MHTTHIKDLIPDTKNRRKHTPRNVGMIVDAMHKVGTGRSIVIDENNVVMAGNATLEAAGEAGITDLKIVEAKGSELVAVRRTGLSEAQKRDLALYDNRTAELADWDAKQILEDVEASIDLSSFFSDGELQSILDRAEDVNLDDFFVAAPDGDENSEKVKLVLTFSPSQYSEIVKSLKSHGDSLEEGLLKVLNLR